MTGMIILFLGRNIDAVQELIIIVMLALLCMIIYLIILNIKTLIRVRRLQTNDKKDKIDEARYHELNNKIQLLIVVSSIIILIVGFLGYNSIDTIKIDIQGKMDEYIDKLKGYDSIIYNYNTLISTLENERDTTFKSLITTKIESEKTKKGLNQLQYDYRLNAKTYFVKGIKISQKLLKDNTQKEQIYFKDLKKFNSKIPEAFIQEPFVTVVGIGDGVITILKITKEYFEYSFSGYTELDQGLISTFDKIDLNTTDQEERELLSKLKSLLNKSIKQRSNSSNYTEAAIFDLIIIEGINN